MPLPGVSSTNLDGGLGVSSPATSIPHVMGPANQGPLETPTTISNQRQLREIFGTQGKLVDTVGFILAFAGGPVVVTRTDTSVDATYGEADGSSQGATSAMVADAGGGVDNEINLAVATSEPLNDFDLLVRIIVGGARSATKFQYSLDGGRTMSPTIAAAASVLLGDSGVTLEFEVGTTAPYVAGAEYAGTSRQAHYDATDLGGAFDAIEESLLVYDFLVLAGEAATASAAATLFATVSTRLNSLQSELGKPTRAMMGGGFGAASAALAAHAALVQPRIAIVYGDFQASPPLSMVGRSLPALPAVVWGAALAAANVMSTDLAQTSGADTVGAIPGALAIGHNEFLANAGLDDIKVSTLRTYPNLIGFYLTNLWLKSGVGSDFEFWQHGRIMDRANIIADREHSLLISSSVIAKNDGTGSLTEVSAQSIEKRVQRALDNEIGSALRGVGPIAIDGTPGHVSEIRYQVDRTNNVLSTKTIIYTVAIVPRGYAKFFSGTFSYRLQA